MIPLNVDLGENFTKIEIKPLNKNALKQLV